MKKKIAQHKKEEEYPSGWEGFGKFVPPHRLNKAYRTVKEMLPGIDNETAFAIVGKCANFIRHDRPFDIIGNPTAKDAMQQWMKEGRIKNKELDTDITRIDLTGRYRLLAELLTD